MTFTVPLEYYSSTPAVPYLTVDNVTPERVILLTVQECTHVDGRDGVTRRCPAEEAQGCQGQAPEDRA